MSIAADNLKPILDMRARGLSASKIGEALGCSRNAVCVSIYRAGLTNPTSSESRSRRGTGALSDEWVRFIRTNYCAGHPKYGALALARLTGVSTWSISKVVSRNTYRHVADVVSA